MSTRATDASVQWIAIGDIHGCARTLDALLDQLAPSADDHLIFMGDYVDRGPDSRGVLERLIRLEQEHPATTFLRGNHDQMMLDYVDTGALSLWRVNGGLATLASYMDRDALQIPDAHVDFLRRTHLFYETDAYVFVHAGLKPGFSVAENLRFGGPDIYLWERSHLNTETLRWEKTVVCGHTPQAHPTDRPKLINTDTGCVYHERPGLGKLSAVRLPARTWTQVAYQG